MKYCEDANCPNLGGEIGDATDCKLGFRNTFRTPKSMHEAVYGGYCGHVMPKICRVKFKRVEAEK